MSPAGYTEFKWQTVGPTNGNAGKRLIEEFIRLVGRLDNVNRICDLGCGNGFLANQLAELGYEVTGVDASETGLEIARRSYTSPRFVSAVIDADLCGKVKLKDFDLVVSSDVIEHLYRPADLIAAASCLLKPRGQILIGTPYHGYVKNLALSLTGKMDSHFTALTEGGHIKFFSVKTLSELLRLSGFADLRFSFYGRAPLLWMNMICHARKSD